MTYIVSSYINGKKHPHAQAERRELKNPANETLIGHVEYADTATLNLAIESAQKAFPAWSSTPPLKRARILFTFKALLEKNQDKLAALVTLEHGKTLDDAKGSVARGIELVEFLCGIPHLLKGDYSENVGSGVDCYTIRQPLGICAGVSPFNFPVMVPIWMMIPAIACGNCFILKPSEQDPSAPLLLAELLTEAGVPDGVVTVLNGDKRVVDALLEHPAIHAITAVASTPVAEYIYKKAINFGKRANTFGGAKNHALILPDADIETTVDAITGACFGSAGERCMALSVAMIVEDKENSTRTDAFVQLMAQKARVLKIGAGDCLDEQQRCMDMGPLISQAHRERVKQAIAIGVEEGATLVVDGRKIDIASKAGYFLGASVFDHVTTAMKLYQEEIFGPVLAIVRVSSFDEAIRLINQHPFGNGTAIFTQNGEWAHEFVQRIQVGMVGINVPIPVPIAYHPFGGWKKSLFGDIAMHGEQGIQFYTKIKTVTARWPKTTHAGSGFAMPTMK